MTDAADGTVDVAATEGEVQAAEIVRALEPSRPAPVRLEVVLDDQSFLGEAFDDIDPHYVRVRTVATADIESMGDSAISSKSVAERVLYHHYADWMRAFAPPPADSLRYRNARFYASRGRSAGFFVKSAPSAYVRRPGEPLSGVFRGAAVVAPAQRSKWADAIGPVFSAERAASLLSMSPRATAAAAEAGALLGIKMRASGSYVYPVGQFIGREVPVATTWVLAELHPGLVDRSTLAAWMNTEHPDLDGETVWDHIRASGGEVTDGLRLAVEDFLAATR